MLKSYHVTPLWPDDCLEFIVSIDGVVDIHFAVFDAVELRHIWQKAGRHTEARKMDSAIIRIWWTQTGFDIRGKKTGRK